MRTAIICAAIIISSMIYHIAHLIRPDIIPEAVEWGQLWSSLIFLILSFVWDMIDMRKDKSRDSK